MTFDKPIEDDWGHHASINTEAASSYIAHQSIKAKLHSRTGADCYQLHHSAHCPNRDLEPCHRDQSETIEAKGSAKSLVNSPVALLRLINCENRADGGYA